MTENENKDINETLDYFRKQSKEIHAARTRNILLWGLLPFVLGLIIVAIFFYTSFQKQQIIQQKIKQANFQADSIKSLIKLLSTDKIDCSAQPTDETIDNRTIYIITFRITDSTVIPQLKEVDYFFNHPTFQTKLNPSSDSLNGFQLSYRGWGCIDSVGVFLHYKNGMTDTIQFPMCKKVHIVLPSSNPS